jgi:DNA-directed RNA polymerase subunit RPC12/RpoP
MGRMRLGEFWPTEGRMGADVALECLDCGRRVVVPLAKAMEWHGTEARLDQVARRHRCGGCGSKRVEARPAYADRTPDGGPMERR